MISINKVGKKYKRYHSNWDRLFEWLTFGRKIFHTPQWALRDISLKISRGESIGIIGQNGAGKSTLLKILSGTTYATEGSITINGRIAALLELGLGFHPEFSGRDNAMISCRMMGLTNDQIHNVLPEIELFSELGDYFDQPLRVYSTGMQMRLAFSTATVICPDVLIVDEALSVGDAYFQHKCIQRIRAFQNRGMTLLFVSHDPGAVKSLCQRAILLHEGRKIHENTPDVVFDYYNGLITKKNSDESIKQAETADGTIETRSGSKKAEIKKIELLDTSHNVARAFRVGEDAIIRCHIKLHESMSCPTVGLIIRDRMGNDVFGTNSYHLESKSYTCYQGENWVFSFQVRLNLGYGNFSLTVGVHSRDNHLGDNYDWWDQCLIFQMIPNNSFRFEGLVSLPVKIDIQKMAEK